MFQAFQGDGKQNRAPARHNGVRTVLTLAMALPLAAQAPTDINFRVRPKDDKTRFHWGEAISLELLFSSSTPDTYSVMVSVNEPVHR